MNRPSRTGLGRFFEPWCITGISPPLSVARTADRMSVEIIWAWGFVEVHLLNGPTELFPENGSSSLTF